MNLHIGLKTFRDYQVYRNRYFSVLCLLLHQNKETAADTISKPLPNVNVCVGKLSIVTLYQGHEIMTAIWYQK